MTNPFPPTHTTALIASARSEFHSALVKRGVLSVNEQGVPSNADKGNTASVSYALGVAHMIRVSNGGTKLSGQTLGNAFEEITRDFLEGTFPALDKQRPGDWEIKKINSRKAAESISGFEQYAHLKALATAIESDPTLQGALGNSYAIAPDITISREPVSDQELNSGTRGLLVGPEFPEYTSLRAINNSDKLLHAVISCKWTLRSDRAQNARSEALNLIRNRKGRVPHIVVVTAEPLPSRISSLALGTGDLDCVYHFALQELMDSITKNGSPDSLEMIKMMVEGKRLKDISDLPFDLAI